MTIVREAQNGMPRPPDSPSAQEPPELEPPDRPWPSRSVASCVHPSVWATAVPFPSFLGYTFSYSLRVPRGVVLVDLGWDDDAAWSAFLLGLSPGWREPE